VGEPVVEQDWPPAGAVFQGALYYGETHLRRRDYGHAYRQFARASEAAPGVEERELARGLTHLAAAGYKRAGGDHRGYERQIEHARARLGPYLPAAWNLDLAALLELVES
jgi:hypothetical protein